MSRVCSPLPLAIVALAIIGFLTSCTPVPQTSPAPTAEFGNLGAEGCKPASPIVDAEVQGTPAAPGASAFGKIQVASTLPLRVDPEVVKLVVRVTGTGDLGVLINDPTGAEQSLMWGPEAHTASNFDRPGDEWGMGFTFDQPGCWKLALTRASVPSASFWFDVK